MTRSLKAPNIWTIIFIGMILRVLWAMFAPVNPVSDSVAYETFARNIWQHGVYGWTPDNPSAYWAVGTSAITAGTFFVFGDSYFGTILLNLLSALITMVTVYRLGQIYFSEATAYWAVVLLAFWPNLIIFTSILSSELYFIALTSAGLYFWARPTGKAWVNILLCGLIWGAACYIRPVILLFPTTLLIASVSLGVRGMAIAAVKTAITTAMILLIVSPWSARNEEVLGKRYLVSANFGANLWMGNNPESTGGYMPIPPETEGMSERERDTYLNDLAKAYIKEDLGRFAYGVFQRIGILHNRETIGVAWNEATILSWVGPTGLTAAKGIASLYWYALVAAALGGVAFLFRTQKLGALFNPFFGGWAYFTAVHAVIVVEDRYHMPSTPFIALLSAVTLTWLIGKFGQNRHATP